jgi:uncharacterized protein (TIGR03382 family)
VPYDAGVDVGVDGGADGGVDAGADAGPVVVDAGPVIDAGVDAGTTTRDAGSYPATGAGTSGAGCGCTPGLGGPDAIMVIFALLGLRRRRSA